MKEDEIVAQLVSEVNTATANDVDVRTAGGDQPSDPDQVIIEWDASRLSVNGHNSKGGVIRDTNNNAIGIEHHTYFQMEADCQLVFEDEIERDQAIQTVRAAFSPYEKNASAFDKDTAEWEIMMSSPRDNSQFEPDWYIGGVVLRFIYVTRADETGRDTLEDVEDNVLTNPSQLVREGEDLIIYNGDTYTVPANKTEVFKDVYVNGTLDVDGILVANNVYDNGTIDNDGEIRTV